MTDGQPQEEQRKSIGSFGSFRPKRQMLAPQPIELPGSQHANPPEVSSLNASDSTPGGLTPESPNASSLNAGPPVVQTTDTPAQSQTSSGLNASSPAFESLNASSLTPEYSEASLQNAKPLEASGLEGQTPKYQQAKHLDYEMARVPAGQQVSELRVGRSKVQVSKRLGIERMQKTVWLPIELAKWLDHQSVDEGREIAEIATEALEMYRDLWSRRR